MKVTAKLKYLRISPRKVRRLVNLIKEMDIGEAKLQLQLKPRRAAKPLLKLLDSALASAKHEFSLEEKNLYISRIIVNEGPTLKRFRARARGSAAPIMKRTSHVILELEEKVPSKERPTKKKPKVVPVETLEPRPKEVLKAPEKSRITDRIPQIKKKPKKKEFLDKIRLRQIGKKIFRRKSI